MPFKNFVILFFLDMIMSKFFFALSGWKPLHTLPKLQESLLEMNVRRR